MSTDQNGFRITWGSDSQHEKLTAEIEHLGRFVAMLTQEEGFDQLKIEFFSPTDPDKSIYAFKLQDFLSAVERARTRLAQISGAGEEP